MSEEREEIGIAGRFRGFRPVAVDVETGGFNANSGALVELAAVVIEMTAGGELRPGATFRYHVQPFHGSRIDPASLAVNGICTIAAAFFGSCFPTTIYIGHPGWKAMGARHGYSILNGVLISLLCLVGGISLLSRGHGGVRRHPAAGQAPGRPDGVRVVRRVEPL